MFLWLLLSGCINERERESVVFKDTCTFIRNNDVELGAWVGLYPWRWFSVRMHLFVHEKGVCVCILEKRDKSRVCGSYKRAFSE